MSNVSEFGMDAFKKWRGHGQPRSGGTCDHLQNIPAWDLRDIGCTRPKGVGACAAEGLHVRNTQTTNTLTASATPAACRGPGGGTTPLRPPQQPIEHLGELT